MVSGYIYSPGVFQYIDTANAKERNNTARFGWWRHCSWFAATVVPYFTLALIIHHCFNQLLLGTQQGARRIHNAGSQGASVRFVTGKQSVAHYKAERRVSSRITNSALEIT